MSKKKKPILVLGYFGYENNQLDGQTVKTRDIFKLAKDHMGDDRVDYYDTQRFQSKRLSLLTMFRKVCQCKTLIYLPAHNNLKYIFPIIWILSYLCKFDIHYFVVGGWLSEFIKPLPVHRSMLRHIKGIHVEPKKLKNDLEQRYQYRNVDIFPNFRFFDYVPVRACQQQDKLKCLKLVFVSRVCEAKGLDTLKRLCQSIELKKADHSFRIDFYGQITDSYYSENYTDMPNCLYKGVLQPKEVIKKLKEYDALIFPTHYEGEGCPGILVEALFAGLPIIASDWKYNSEFVVNEVNGFLCPVRDITAYENAIKSLFYNPNLREEMSKASYSMSVSFSQNMAKKLFRDILK